MYKYLLIPLIVILSFQDSEAQDYKLSKNSKITFSGTSSLHDWTMVVEKAEGNGMFIIENNEIKEIADLKLTIEAESMKSGKSGMDANAYKALKTDKYKNISFSLISLQPIKKEGNINKMMATGKLTIAGVTKTVKVATDCKIDANGQVTCKGSVPMKMTDFNVEPPTAMFGTVKSGDEITVDFNAVFIQ
ncbi:MAG: YceI family protein [Candidatus Cyclobacteriaceae bacterium M2_1C_046]